MDPIGIGVFGGVPVAILATLLIRNVRRRMTARDLQREEEWQKRLSAQMDRIAEERHRYSAAISLSEFIRESDDLSVSWERQQTIAAVKLEDRAETNSSAPVFVAVLTITRMVALARDIIRQEDVNRLMAFVKACPYRAQLIDPVESEALRALHESPSDETMVTLPVRMLADIESPEARTLRDLLIAYAEEVARDPEEALPKRSLGAEMIRALLAEALPDFGTESADQDDDSETGSGYALFGLTDQCTDAELRAAYLERLKEWHPDVLSTVPNELREIATIRVQQFNDTYAELRSSRMTS